MRKASAPPSRVNRRIARRSSFAIALAYGMFVLAGCAPVQAEVGSAPPRTDSGVAADGSLFGDGSIIGDGGVARCDRLAPLRLYQRNLRPAAASTDINFIFKVENATGAPLVMSSLKARYYFTNELAQPTAIDVFYTDTCCSNKVTDFNDEISTALVAVPAMPSADAFLEMGFARTVGSLAPGDAVQVEVAFHDVGYVRSLTQTNDHSYAATAAGSQAQWDSCPGPQCDPKFTNCAMTLLRDDVLVWGTAP